MATAAYGYGSLSASSPRSRGKDARNNIPCRNLIQYGHCRNERDGCMYNHDRLNGRSSNNNLHHEGAGARTFNVDSPSFTPASLNTAPSLAKKAFSPKAANAAAFVPRNNRIGPPRSPPTFRPQSQQQSPGWRNRDIPEFVPQGFGGQHQPETSVTPGLGDPFNPYSEHQHYGSLEGTPPNQQINPYNSDTAPAPTLPYYQQQQHLPPLQHHLYAQLGPRREDLQPYQRTAHEFFIPEDLRQELQRKADAALQVLPNSSLPPRVDEFHSLVPLDINAHKSLDTFGWKTWLYKAARGKDGARYALRRIEGYRISHEREVHPIRQWERLDCASLVNIRGCFTTREFGDSSLIIFTDYHPTAKTLAEHHFPNAGSLQRGRQYSPFVPETVLWSYLVQLANALKTVHSHQLAARVITPSKVILTSKNRIRLNGVGVLDIVSPDNDKSMLQQQQEDMLKLGLLILSLATNNPMICNSTNITPSQQQQTTHRQVLDTLPRAYSPQVKEALTTLLLTPTGPPSIETFLPTLTTATLTTLNSALNLDDELTSNLGRELENSRLVRLMTKLNFINERPEYALGIPPTSTTTTTTIPRAGPDKNAWSETGPRYYLKLFRDYVFHSVTADGRPALDLGHVITCLNKLDAGSEERIVLVSRDEEYAFVVSFREVKRGLEGAWGELVRAGTGGRR